MGTVIFWSFVIPVCLVVGVAIWAAAAARAARRRRQQLTYALAAGRGWLWFPTYPGYVDRWRGRPFGVGGSRRAHNVLQGYHGGRAITVFDYSYVVSSGKNSQTITHTVFAMRLPAQLPWIELGGEGATGGAFSRALGAGDLQLENEEFNRLYRISCTDDRYAMAVLHPRMMQLLLDTRVYWRIEGSDLVCSMPGLARPENVIWYLDVMTWITNLVPPFVVRDYGRAG